jgi:peroxiredoxin Q/BCP
LVAQRDTAPDFTLPDQDGNDVTLSELPVVLYFYPKAES